MLLCSTIYDALVDIIRADRRGLTLSPDEFSRMAVIVNQRIYARYYSNFEASADNIDVMGGFKIIHENIALVAGVGSLPVDYYQFIGKPITNTGRYVDLVSSLELAERTDDYLTQPTITYPCAILGDQDALDNTQIRIYPVDPAITSIYLDYLRITATPYLDYYTDDDTLVVTFMSEGATVNVPTGSTYRDGTPGGGAGIGSLTKDFEWSDSDLPLIIAMFCQLIGVAIPDELLVKVGNLDEQKN
jgi:hypothetical protein